MTPGDEGQQLDQAGLVDLGQIVNGARAGVPAVQFQVQLAFEGVEDRLDGLPQGSEQRGPGPVGFTAAGPAQ